MINLLPTDYRLGLKFSRTNVRLGQWLTAGVLLVSGLIFIIGAAWVYTDQQIKDLNRSIKETETQLQQQKLEQVQKQADQISQNVRVISQILGREIRFSQLIQEIGKVMPPKTVLNSLTLSNVKGPIDLTAGAKDYASAARIAANLSDPENDLFESVDINNINCTETQGPYLCNASFKVLFSKDASSRFLNVPSGSGR